MGQHLATKHYYGPWGHCHRPQRRGCSPSGRCRRLTGRRRRLYARAPPPPRGPGAATGLRLSLLRSSRSDNTIVNIEPSSFFAFSFFSWARVMSSQIAVSAARPRHQSADSARRERSGSVYHGYSRHTHKSHARRGSENLSRHRRSEQFGSIGDNSDRHKRRWHSPKLCSDRRQKRMRRGSCDSRYSDSHSSDEVISLNGSNNTLYRVQNGGRGSDSGMRMTHPPLLHLLILRL
ncbi:hypothetical protein GE061_015379 [Apolygus lucorum]|uniref:Uncharacterized protein n=1 Tax=Apolygus lucorum TaxID=248454 RepID=A0A8S9XMW6_APOLU|nr:hypothetical protein GE061_015379 [Apolygus lucorum]